MTADPEKDFDGRTEAVSGPWIEVDLDAISHNIEQIHRFRGARLMPVIKANAYGHGDIRVAHHLKGLEPVHGVCVGVVREAIDLRESGLKIPLLNLGPYTRAEAKRIVSLNISQSVFTGAVAWLDEIARDQNRVAGVHIKIDTGLGRVGVSHCKALEFIERVADMANVRIEGVFTSLSEDPEFDRIQMDRFQSALDRAEARGISLGIKHAASSAAILEFPKSALNMIRPGIMVFGHYPSTAEKSLRRIPLKPALTLKTRVICVKSLKKGDSVAYHREYKVEGNETVITGGIGYADGYPTAAARRAECLVGGIRHPLIASVTANHIYIRSRRNDIKPGEEIVLYGKQGGEEISLENMAQLCGRSVYNLLSRLNPLLPRFYLKTSSDQSY